MITTAPPTVAELDAAEARIRELVETGEANRASLDIDAALAPIRAVLSRAAQLHLEAVALRNTLEQHGRWSAELAALPWPGKRPSFDINALR